jgi:hypothetical protein
LDSSFKAVVTVKVHHPAPEPPCNDLDEGRFNVYDCRELFNGVAVVGDTAVDEEDDDDAVDDAEDISSMKRVAESS